MWKVWCGESFYNTLSGVDYLSCAGLVVGTTRYFSCFSTFLLLQKRVRSREPSRFNIFTAVPAAVIYLVYWILRPSAAVKRNRCLKKIVERFRRLYGIEALDLFAPLKQNDRRDIFDPKTLDQF